ncbi:MAG: hypothetical protein C4576_11440 [Desulfobacteraceae bacterium]|nr:MAG: hypothetical protein C4576_11440 [Desulfobacteraceae bacterium]
MKFQIQDMDGNVVEEANVVITKGDVLVLQFTDHAVFRSWASLPQTEKDKVMETWKRTAKGEAGVLVLPPEMKILVLHKTEGE